MKRLLLIILTYLSFALTITAQETPFSYSDGLFEAAKHGDADAMYKIGLCYYVGAEGCTPLILNAVPMQRDYDKAFTFLSKAAKKGSVLAMVNLGNMYRTGNGAPKGQDIKKALEWYKKAAKKGYADAYTNIGQVYEKDAIALIKARVVKTSIHANAEDIGASIWEQTSRKSVEYYRLAAEKGSALGAYNLGLMYSSIASTTVATDYQEARKWYRKAAELGMTKAINNLAVMYISGSGTPKNPRVGLELMKMAAAAGEPMALHNLGVYYYNGPMLPVDKERALKFFFLANEKGQDNAKALSECYQAKLNNADRYATFDEWKESTRQMVIQGGMPAVEIPQPDTLFVLDCGYVIRDCGAWSVVSDDGICLTERRYDKIVLNDSTGELRAVIGGYVTPLCDDCTEENPVLDQILDRMTSKSETMPGITISTSTSSASIPSTVDMFLRNCFDDKSDYKAVGYYNMAVSKLGDHSDHIALMYADKSLEMNPEFQLAKDLQKELQKEAKARKKEAKKRKRQFIMECVSIGTSGLSTALSLAATIQADKRSSQQAEVARRSANREKNRARAKEHKEQAKMAKREMVGMISHRAVSNAYREDIGIINDMKINPEHCDQQMKTQIQSQMKQMRSQYNLPYNEMEDW